MTNDVIYNIEETQQVIITKNEGELSLLSIDGEYAFEIDDNHPIYVVDTLKEKCGTYMVEKEMDEYGVTTFNFIFLYGYPVVEEVGFGVKINPLDMIA